MRLMVMFSSQLTTSLLYKLVFHIAIFCPTLHDKNTDATACDVTATQCNHAYLGTRSTPLKTTNSSTSESNYLVGCQWKSTCTSSTVLWVQHCRIYQHNYYENLQLTLTAEITNVRILVQLSGLHAGNDWKTRQSPRWEGGVIRHLRTALLCWRSSSL